MIVAPERFGRQPLSPHEMAMAAERSSRELRKMFHDKPLTPQQARKGRGISPTAGYASRSYRP